MGKLKITKDTSFKTPITYIDFSDINKHNIVNLAGDSPVVCLYGTLTDDPTEIIVVKHLRNRISSANVCHLTNDDIGRPCICDLSGYDKITVADNSTVKDVDGCLVTMISVDKLMPFINTDWIF